MTHTAKHKAGATLEHIHGQVESVRVYKEDTGFCVLMVEAEPHPAPIKLIGVAPRIPAGQFIEAQGHWEHSEKWGAQFRAVELRAVRPSTTAGIEKYLASGVIRNVGRSLAKKLVAHFGERLIEIIEHDPAQLEAVPGIGKQRRRQIVRAFAEHRAAHDTLMFLHSHGLGPARAQLVYRKLGDQAIARISEDPYQLTRIEGIGFVIADNIAQSIGIPASAPQRLDAAVLHALTTLSDEGHCAATPDMLGKRAARLLARKDAVEAVAPAHIDAAIEKLVSDKHILRQRVENTDYFYLPSLYYAERDVAGPVRRLLAGAPPWNIADPRKAIDWAEHRRHARLSASQQDALRSVLNNKLSIVTGGPGTGKTTIINHLLDILEAKNLRIACAAPSGKAAKRMSEATGRAASTLHRLLGFDPARGGAEYDSDNPLPIDVLILDESSMIDLRLMSVMLAAVPDHAAVVFVGDTDQLPSVGPGKVLADLIDSDLVPSNRLTEIFRQAAASMIITNAHRIIHGEAPVLLGPSSGSDFIFIEHGEDDDVLPAVLNQVCDHIPAQFGFDPLEQLQVIVPMNKGRVGVATLNEALQARLNGQATITVERYGRRFGIGDKVIQSKNNYELGVFNGDVGVIAAIDTEGEKVAIRFDNRVVDYDFADMGALSLAYAISIHKSQGSEYPAVVIPLLREHYVMLNRQLLYTAVTRGKQLVVIIGHRRAVQLAVNNARAVDRCTTLRSRLLAACLE